MEDWRPPPRQGGVDRQPDDERESDSRQKCLKMLSISAKLKGFWRWIVKAQGLAAYQSPMLLIAIQRYEIRVPKTKFSRTNYLHLKDIKRGVDEHSQRARG